MVKEIKMYQTSDGKTFTERSEAHRHEALLTKTYEVTLYYRATYTTTINAINEDDALEKAKKEWYPEDLNDFELDDYDVDEEENLIDDDYDEEEGD